MIDETAEGKVDAAQDHAVGFESRVVAVMQVASWAVGFAVEEEDPMLSVGRSGSRPSAVSLRVLLWNAGVLVGGSVVGVGQVGEDHEFVFVWETEEGWEIGRAGCQG